MLINSSKIWKSKLQYALESWIIKKARKFQKNIYLYFIDYAKAFGYVDHNKLWKILQEMGIPVPFSSPGELPDPGIEPTSLALAGAFFTTKLPGKPILFL